MTKAPGPGGVTARAPGPAGAGQVERGAVVDAHPNKRQTQRDVHAAFQAKKFYGDQTLVMVLGDHDVELAAARPHKDRVGRVWPRRLDAFRPGVVDRGRDLRGVFSAE